MTCSWISHCTSVVWWQFCKFMRFRIHGTLRSFVHLSRLLIPRIVRAGIKQFNYSHIIRDLSLAFILITGNQLTRYLALGNCLRPCVVLETRPPWEGGAYDFVSRQYLSYPVIWGVFWRACREPKTSIVNRIRTLRVRGWTNADWWTFLCLVSQLPINVKLTQFWLVFDPGRFYIHE